MIYERQHRNRHRRVPNDTYRLLGLYRVLAWPPGLCSGRIRTNPASTGSRSDRPAGGLV